MDELAQLPMTPTEELIIDVLVARFRLGDTLWTFDSRNKPAMRRLEKRGLIHVDSGVVENTVKVSLSNYTLQQFGSICFQVTSTMGYLPSDPGPDPDGRLWAKRHLQQLIALSQNIPATDPQALNSAHLLIIQMIHRKELAHETASASKGGVLLYRRGGRAIEILAGGQEYLMRQAGEVPRSTSAMTDALRFISRF